MRNPDQSLYLIALPPSKTEPHNNETSKPSPATYRKTAKENETAFHKKNLELLSLSFLTRIAKFRIIEISNPYHPLQAFGLELSFYHLDYPQLLPLLLLKAMKRCKTKPKCSVYNIGKLYTSQKGRR